jgi:single-strand DNA-binding protein
MGSLNRVYLMGNLTREVEMRSTPSGMAVADLGVAVNERYRNKEGQEVEKTCFADVVVWGRQAETCERYLAKGSGVLVEGRLQLDRWSTEAGEKRSRLRVRADRVQFVGRPRGNGVEPGAGLVSPSGSEVPVAAAQEPSEGDNLPF